MNVFSVLTSPTFPWQLSEDIYNSKTSRDWPYCQNHNGELKSFALCPICQNPVLLVNRYVPSTKSKTLYARHAGYSVPGLADHDQEAYLDCPLHNPERFDSELRRKAGSKRNDEVRLLLLHHLDLVITQLEGAMGIKLTDQAVESMLLDFIKREGWEYKAISLYNLPLGFAYMTEAKDLFGCRVTDTNMALQIKAKSEGFETTSNGLIFRRRDVKGTKLRLYFNNHQIDNGHPAKESVNVEIVELKGATLKPKTIFTKTISFSGTLFFNTLMRWERLRVIASDHL